MHWDYYYLLDAIIAFYYSIGCSYFGRLEIMPLKLINLRNVNGKEIVARIGLRRPSSCLICAIQKESMFGLLAVSLNFYLLVTLFSSLKSQSMKRLIKGNKICRPFLINSECQLIKPGLMPKNNKYLSRLIAIARAHA